MSSCNNIPNNGVTCIKIKCVHLYTSENSHIYFVIYSEINAGMITLAERNGISKPTYYRRIKTGMDPYEAATKPKGHTAYLELARKNGIKDATFYQRITRDMNPYEAATKPVASRKKVQQIS